MAAQRAARAEAEPRDTGVTLVELSVAMLIGGILLSVLAVFITQSLRSTTSITARTNAGADARIGLEYLQHDLRVAVSPDGTASPFVAADSTSMTFYASIGASTGAAAPTPTEVWYWVDTSASTPCLRRATATTTVTNGVATGPATRPAGTCVASGSINASGDALFTYYPVSTSATPSPAAMTTLSLDDVAQVAVDLEVTPTGSTSARPSVLTSTVSLINVVNAKWEAGSS